MIQGLKPYPEYKDSGIPWLGDIPAHWDLRRTKYILSEIDSRSTDGNEQLLRVSQYTGVTERKGVDGDDNSDTRASSLAGYKKVEPLDLVINIMLAWNGSMGVSPFRGIASPAYCVYRFKDEIHPWYFHYLFRSPLYKGLIKTASTGIVESRLRLYSDSLGRLEAVLPPTEEQKTIVRFLEHSFRPIDAFIRTKRKLITLLNEQKQVIIHRAVTRGLNPSTPLKESGVRWIGDIPTHWEIRKLGSLFKRKGSGTTPTGDRYYDGNIPWVMSGDLNDGTVVTTKRMVTQSALADHSALKLYPIGSLIVAMYGATIGKTAILGTEACTNQACCVLAGPREETNPYFVQAAVSMARNHLIQLGYGGGQPNINSEIVRSLFVPHPPANERREIMDFLSRAVNPLNTAIAQTEQEIALMQEYRTRLTADVVTGKLDVRQAAARLSDLTDESAADAENPPEELDEDLIDELEPMNS